MVDKIMVVISQGIESVKNPRPKPTKKTVGCASNFGGSSQVLDTWLITMVIVVVPYKDWGTRGPWNQMAMNMACKIGGDH